MDNAVRAIISFISLHAGWTFPILFLVSFGESFVFLSFAFPATTVLLAAGALVPSGVLPFWPVLTGAVMGAVLGDAISYGLGFRFGHLLETRWPFTRHPDLLPQGYAFFEKHGSKSIFIGRFFGPLRAAIPLVAGISKMPRGRFWIANVLSALIWAPALMIPGLVAGYAAGLLGAHKTWKIALTVAGVVAAVALIWLARHLGLFKKRKSANDFVP